MLKNTLALSCLLVVTPALGAQELPKSSQAWNQARAHLAKAQAQEESQTAIGVQVTDAPEALCLHLGLEPGSLLLVTDVTKDLPAANSGVLKHDLLVAVDGVPLRSRQGLKEAMARCEPGDTIVLNVMRRGSSLEIPVEVAERKSQYWNPVIAQQDLAKRDYDAALAYFNAQLAQRALDAKDLSATANNLSTQRQALTDNLAQVQIDNQDLQRQIGELRSGITAILRHNHELRSRLDQLTQDVTARLTREADDLTRNIQGLNDDQKEEINSTMRRLVKDFTVEMTQLSRQVSSKEVNITRDSQGRFTATLNDVIGSGAGGSLPADIDSAADASRLDGMEARLERLEDTLEKILKELRSRR